MLHQLSDVLPNLVYMTLPTSWTIRRMQVPAGLHLDFADVPQGEVEKLEGVPVTKVRRTIQDSIRSAVSPDLIEQAIQEAKQQGLLHGSAADKLEEQLRRGMVA